MPYISTQILAEAMQRWLQPVTVCTFSSVPHLTLRFYSSLDPEAFLTCSNPSKKAHMFTLKGSSMWSGDGLRMRLHHNLWLHHILRPPRLPSRVIVGGSAVRADEIDELGTTSERRAKAKQVMSVTLCRSASRAQHLLLCPYVTSRLPACTTTTGDRWGTRPLVTAPLAEAKPFSEVPGPRRLPLVGSALSFLFEINRKLPIRELQKGWMQKYGMIYRAKVPTLPEVVVIHEPQDVEALFRAEGKYPSRAPFQIWKQARSELKMEMGVLLS